MAIGYYNLAATLLPQFGTVHNQLAALTVIDGDHLRAVYHLCLAATVEEPHENAIKNINYQFKKIINAWNSPTNVISHQESNPLRPLQTWFIRVHARCSAGVWFSEYDAIEREVLQQLHSALIRRTDLLAGTLEKFVIINAATEWLAYRRLKSMESPDSLRASLY
jgi:hypothetical protein